MGFISIGLKSPVAIRFALVSRCPTDFVRRREKASATTSQPPSPIARIVKLCRHNGIALSNASDVGIPTVTSHGPRATTASPYMRRTPSIPLRCSGARAPTPFQLASSSRSAYRSASGRLARTPPLVSLTVTTAPEGSRAAPRASSISWGLM